LPWSTTEEVAAAQARLARWLRAGFRHRLSSEDLLDVAAQSIAEAYEHLTRTPVRDPEGLLKRIARRNALDEVRRRVGQDPRGPRPAPAPLLADDPALAGTDPSLAAPAQAATLAQAYEEAIAGLASVAPEERMALTLRLVDELPRQTCAALTSRSLDQYKRLYTRALAQLRAELLNRSRDGCAATRALLAQGPLEPLPAARRDAHLAGCLPCRAWARDARDRDRRCAEGVTIAPCAA
jgi:DNA-directed RNA polymerase specialized sigma24 family protein